MHPPLPLTRRGAFSRIALGRDFHIRLETACSWCREAALGWRAGLARFPNHHLPTHAEESYQFVQQNPMFSART